MSVLKCENLSKSYGQKVVLNELNLELVIMPMSFDACQTAVYTGTVDMSISGYSWSETREQNYNLSSYYYAGENENEQVLITLASNGDKFATAEALAGAKVGAQNASLQQSLTVEQLPDNELILFTDLGTAVLQLKNGDFENGDTNWSKLVSTVGVVADPTGADQGNVMQTNEKLVVRAQNIVMEATGCDEKTAAEALSQAQNHPKTALTMILAGCDAQEARERLARAGGFVREAIR